jgi:hypothetical protein
MSSFLLPTIIVGGQNFATYPPYPSNPCRDPGPRSRLHGGSPTTNKHYPLWASGSSYLMRLARWDVPIGTHTHLTLWTRVRNQSHRRPTSLDTGNTPKYHYNATREEPPHGRNHLPCVISHRIGIKEDKLSIG